MRKNVTTPPDTATRERAKITRKCSYPGCPIRVAPNYLMCAPHWNRVPLKLRAELNRAWRKLMLKPTIPNLQDYNEVRERVIEHVKPKEITHGV